MHQKAMDPSIAVEERMYKHEPKSRGSRGTHRMKRVLRIQQLRSHPHPAIHERSNILRFWADEVNLLGVVGLRRANENLNRPPVRLRVTRIDDRILQLNEGLFLCGIEFVRPQESGNNPLGTIL